MPASALRLFSKLVLILLLLPGAVLVNADSCRDAVNAQGYAELADTFSADKALRLAPDSADKPLTEQQACAVLTLLPELPAGASPGWIGDLGEPSLYPRLLPLWEAAQKHPHSEFTLALRELIRRDLANGYNIATSPWPAFDPERTLIYGHSDIRHAQQLLALLTSEDMGARVGFSSKISAYLHRDGWGEPAAGAITLDDHHILIEAREYDLHLEFADAADKQRFMVILSRYAKKQTGMNQPLIHGSWWQPFVRSYTTAKGFEAVAQVDISDGNQTAQVLLSDSSAETLARRIREQAFPWTVTIRPVWVNPAFYRYLSGDFQ